MPALHSVDNRVSWEPEDPGVVGSGSNAQTHGCSFPKKRSNSAVLLQPKKWGALKIPTLGFRKPLEMKKIIGKACGFSCVFLCVDVNHGGSHFSGSRYLHRFLTQKAAGKGEIGGP